MKRIYILFLLAVALYGSSQQTTFRIQYNFSQFDFPTAMLNAPGPNYVFSSRVVSGFGLPIGTRGGLTEVDQYGTHVRSTLYNNGGFTTSVDFADVKTATAGGYIVTGGANSQCLVAKIPSAFGTPTWQYRYVPVSGASAYGNRIIQASDGGFVVAGTATHVNNGIAMTDSSKMFALKVDANGTVLWSKVFFYSTAFDDDDFLNSVTEVSDGYVFVGSVTTSFNGSSKGSVIKTDFNGNVQWARQIGADDIESVITDAGNNIVMCGLDGVGGYLYNWSAPNSGPTVIGTNTKYTAAGLGVSVGNLTKTADNNFGVFVSGFTALAFTTMIVKVNRSTGAVMFAKSYNSFISILPTGIQAVDSGFLMNSLSADTAGGGGYDFAITKTDINGNQGGSSCPATSPTVVANSYSPSVNTFTATPVGTPVRSSGGITAVSSIPGVVTNCISVACTPPPTPTASAAPSSICNGQSTVISGSGSGSGVTYVVYSASSGGTLLGTAPLTVSPTTATTYYVQANNNSIPGCVSARASVTVGVSNPPSAVGSISGLTSVCVGSQTYSISTVSGATSYTWSISGGGTIQSGQGTLSITVNWTTVGGPYTVSVTATNTCGSTSNTKQVTVLGSVSGVTASASPNPACVGNNVVLTGGGTNVTTWSWSGPGGYSSSTQSPTLGNIQTAAAGTYTLNASGACGSGTATASVTVNAPPTAVGASANPNPACANNTVNLTGNGTNATSWSWSGPNSFSAATQNASVVNAQSNATGTYTVTASNTCGNTTATVNVTVNDIPLSVTATANPTAVCPGASLSLGGSATGATSYSWTGPSFNSNQLNNSITNFQAGNAGTYTLTATNLCGSASSPVSVTISSGPINPVVNASLTNICSNSNLSLTSSAAGATSYQWSGPNGFSSASQNPSVNNITVADSGKYTVVFTNICGTASAFVNVDVDNPIQNVAVNAAPNDSVCTGSNINLSASGTNVNTWSWTGPNSFVSAQQNPTISNSTAVNSGTYTVTASNACGTSQANILVVVSGAASSVTASASSNGLVCNGTTVNLSASGLNISSYTWSGPNGFTSTQQNPAISNATVAATGIYTVTGYNTCANVTATVSVEVDTLIQNLSSSASPNDTVCANATINLTATANGTTLTTSWNWTGPNSFSAATQNASVPNAQANSSGTYTITATNACNTSSSTINVLVNDAIQNLTATASSSGVVCSGQTVNLSANGTNVNSYTWSGPNNFSSSSQNTSINPAHTFNNGTYTVSASNACGNVSTTVSVEVDTVIQNFAAVAGGAGDTVCAGANIQLNASGTGVTSWSWNGPGFTSAQQNVSLTNVQAANSGAYIVTGTNACGSASDTIDVLVNTVPLTPSTIIGSLTKCGNDTATYSVTPITNATSYTWTISSGGTITSGQGTNAIVVSWTTAGSYTVSVIASNNCGGSTASSINVTVNAPAPVMSSIVVGDTSVCPGVFPYSISNIPNATSYTWTVNGGGTIASGQGTNAVTVNWSTAGVHTVSVTASNTCGSSSAASLNVNVHASPTPATVTVDAIGNTICEGTTATITATNSVGGIITYNFYDAATGGNFVGTSPLTVSPANTTVYYLEVVNDFGCTSSGGRIPTTITVIHAPEVLGISASRDSVCYGNTTTLTANVSPSGATVIWWNSPIGSDSISTSNPFTTPVLTQSTTYYVDVTVSGVCHSLSGRFAVPVTVIPLPVVTLTSDKIDNTVFQNEVLTFTALPDSFDNYEFFWNTPPSVQSESKNTFASSSFNDKDSVWVIATDNGCASLESYGIVHVVDFPNAFTPNNDGKNDFFLKGYDLVILNRWGQELYRGKDGWDGTYKGDKVSPGTYYYVVQLQNITDRTTTVKGNVLLIED